MKKYFKITFLILFLGLFAFMSYEIISKINHKKAIDENIKTIPEFQYLKLDGSVFSNKSLKQDTATIFLYFNSECEHCQAEAQMVSENREKFKPFQLVFISFETLYKIKNFAIQYKLIGYGNIHFLCDSKVTFATTFDVKSVPSLVLYDKNDHLIEKIKGQIKAEVLLRKFRITN
ncbi:TlpA family protein disulfide reductase [Flavobacterium psychrotolerans]|nr:redoxin domain-containing protein [Flavobacterium psychrotolerans]